MIWQSRDIQVVRIFMKYCQKYLNAWIEYFF